MKVYRGKGALGGGVRHLKELETDIRTLCGVRARPSADGDLRAGEEILAPLACRRCREVLERRVVLRHPELRMAISHGLPAGREALAAAAGE